MIQTSEGPYFFFSHALYPFPTCSHTYFFLPPLPAPYLPFVVSFPPPPERLAIPGSTYPRSVLSKDSCPVIVT